MPLTPRQKLNIHSGNEWLIRAAKRYRTPLRSQGLGLDVEVGPPGAPGVDTLAYVGADEWFDRLDLGFLWSKPVKQASSLAMIYHGYKRNHGSIIWALIWGALGYAAPPIADVVALAQGYAKPKYGRGAE